MSKLFCFVVGFVVAVCLAFLFASFYLDIVKKEREKKEAEMQNEVNALTKSLAEAKDSFAKQIDAMKAEKERLQKEKKNLDAEKETLIAKIEGMQQKSKSEETAEKAPPKEKEKELSELEKKQLEALAKLKKILVIGGPAEEALKEALGLDEAQFEQLNQALTEELQSMTDSIVQFYNENFPDEAPLPESPGSLSEPLMKILAKTGNEIADFHNKLTEEDRLALDEGTKTLTDFMEPDSLLMRFGKSLHNTRKETYNSLEGVLNPEQTGKLKEEYLPESNFIFPGNLHLFFGDVDWEKVEEQK